MQLLKHREKNSPSPPCALAIGLVDPFAVDALDVGDSAGDAFEYPTREPAGDVEPCEACTRGHGQGKNFVWLDRFGGHHCPDCAFPPSLGMVARIVWVAEPPADGAERQMVDLTKKLLPILEAEFFRRVASKRQAAYAEAAASGGGSEWDDF